MKELTLNPGETRPIPLGYVWSRIFAKPAASPPSTASSSSSSASASASASSDAYNWHYCQRPVNWYHIMTKQDNLLEVHSSRHAWDRTAEEYRQVSTNKNCTQPISLAGI